MRREFGAVLLGVAGAVALAGLAGGVGGTEVELPQVLSDLLTIPTETASPESIAGNGGGGETGPTLSVEEGANDLFLLGMLGVFGLWLLGAAWTMRAGPAVLAVLAFVAVAVLVTNMAFGGAVTDTPVTVDDPGFTLVYGIVAGVFLLVVLVAGATMLVPPSEWPGTDRAGLLSRLVAAVAGGGPTGTGTGTRRQDPANEVYQAWLAFVDLLDVDSTASPGEAAQAAKRAGLPPDAVETIRRTFEDVRYGDAPVTDRRAERVRAALDRLRADRTGDTDAAAVATESPDVGEGGGSHELAISAPRRAGPAGDGCGGRRVDRSVARRVDRDRW